MFVKLSFHRDLRELKLLQFSKRIVIMSIFALTESKPHRFTKTTVDN